MLKSTETKFYAVVVCSDAQPPIPFVWSKDNKWWHPRFAVPKPVSYNTAKKLVADEKANDKNVVEARIVPKEEYFETMFSK